MSPAFDLAVLKAQSRQSLHRALAVSALYEDEDTDPTPITVRWHSKLARAGALDGGFNVEVIEGINRLVFNQTEITSAGIELVSSGVVTIPQYNNVRFSLEAREPDDGPENVYWTVAQIAPVQSVFEEDEADYIVAEDGTPIVEG